MMSLFFAGSFFFVVCCKILAKNVTYTNESEKMSLFRLAWGFGLTRAAGIG